MIGQTLAHYRITSALGAGGMGEVYRATDTKLNRDVAIKVLPPQVAQAPERLARFRREAQLLAALNHPNIAAIYGLEEADGKPFLALELVEGPDLKERLDKAALPLDEALEIAQQIAEALEAAHGKGIIHRDLKPANVKVTPEGQVKVLDFGLAKAWAGETGDKGSDVSQSPTLTRAGTVEGVILGTAAYMSPEQARGRPVDKRADVWAFGVVLWEMLTGRSLFGGDTVADVIAAVVTREPDLEALPPETPRAVRRLLERCLRKDPRTRMPDMGAVRLELQDARAGGGDDEDRTPGPTEPVGGPRRWERWAWMALAAALATVLVVSHLEAPEPPPPTVHFTVDPPDGWAPIGWGWPSVSPNGRFVAFAGRALDGSAQTLCLRPLGGLTTRSLPGTDGAGMGFWSPDSRHLAFLAGGEIRRIHVMSGSVQTVGRVPTEGGVLGLDWGTPDTILFHAGGKNGRIFRVAAGGGEPVPLTTLDASRGELGHALPQMLPDRRRFLLYVYSEREDVLGTYVASLDSPKDRRRVAPGVPRRQYASGHLLFVRDETLYAQPFDPDHAELSGAPSAVASSVRTWNEFPGVAWFSASPAGAVAYRAGATAAGDVQLTWVDRRGGQLGVLGEPGRYGQIALSPDERSVALEMYDVEGEHDLWTMDVARGVASRVTTAAGSERDPVWAADGRSLVYTARDGETVDLRRKGLRAGDPDVVLSGDAGKAVEEIPEHWSPDGRTLLFLRRDPDTEAQSVWALSPDEGDEPKLLMDNGFRVDEPRISPDERWLA